MIYPSQEATGRLLAERLAEDNGAVLLQGLSGSGKSLVAEEAMRADKEKLIIDAGMVWSRTDDIRKAVAHRCSIVILADPSVSIEWVELIQQELLMNPKIIQMRSLTPTEVVAWLDTATPKLEEDERSLITKYSLGLPLLIERFLTHRPLTRETALLHCVTYLQGVLNQSGFMGKNRDIALRDIIAGYSDSPIPDDVIPLLADAEMGRTGDTPISLLHSRLSEGAEFPTPTTLQLFDLYGEWLALHKDEPNFDVLVLSMPDAEAFLDTIGYSDEGRFGDHDLKRFICADARKGATFYPRFEDGTMCQQMNNNSDSLDSWLQTRMLELARSSGVEAKVTQRESFDRDIVEVQISTPSPLYLHKHDHTPSVVMPVAYTVECALQARGVPYIVRYNDVLFRFDPEKKAYEPLERVKVDYYREAYGHLWDEEEPDESDTME